MTLENLYSILGSNLNEVLQRIPSKVFLVKMLKKFLEDPSKNSLDNAIEANDAVNAFKAVHTMKGIALSLGLSNLSDPCVALTENLRPGTFGDGWISNYEKLCVEYNKIINYIQGLEE